ncbi:phosphatidate cytidylyltransferase [Vibrio mangrovi]|uniref:Phosphatidate cytidylyltransferase n=1 Tax=Vibrio mangrovi TaxID=474394 RepID=A0A1Y6IU51_9VIBR|nr:phosphatidate cytidylyltransferase [Vibrio mangrovi]MDW6001623.1 phosphatidate cytidylyltransferase [Vibrio mangrovi]SMS00350.1 Phosphatidate cytidylyltransferase [Vibrio mangrovi]
MKLRIITALVLAPLVVLGIFKLPLSIFIATLALITLFGFWEWTQFISFDSRFVSLLPAIVIGGVSLWILPEDFTMDHSLPFSFQLLLWGGFLWWIVASYLAVSYPKSRSRWEYSKGLKHLFGLLTLIPFFWSILLLRTEDLSVDPFHGAKLVMFVCLIVWVADSGAYFSGRLWGKHKMAPEVSPNKTIEGLIGGVVAACIVAFGLVEWFELHFSSTGMMLVTILLTVIFSVLGDLVESMFKRVAGIKDSSHIIPGHGGILDRLDSLTAAFPVFAFLYFQV